MKTTLTFLIFFLFKIDLIFAQLSLKEIMQGETFVGHLPENQRWSLDGKHIYFDWNNSNELGNTTYEFDGLSKLVTKISPENENRTISYDKNQADFKSQVLSLDGALIEFDKKTKIPKLIFQASESVFNVQRLNDDTKIVFQMENNLFLVASGAQSSIRQITNFKSGDKKNKNSDSTFLMKQQSELFKYVKNKNDKSNWNKTQKSKPLFTFPMEHFLGDGNIEELQIDPFQKFVIVRSTFNQKEVETSVQNFVTANGYTQNFVARGKVSQDEPNQKVAIYSIERDSLIWLDFSNLTNIRSKPKYMDASGNGRFEKDRALFIHPFVFSKTQNMALCDIRSADNKDRWIVLVDLSKATVKEVEHQHDEAWIGGPGISSWNSEIAVLDWLVDGKSFYFQSEESGYSHVYSYNLSSEKKEQLTSGNFEIYAIELSADKKKFYITANKTHPGNRGFYHFEIATKKWIPIFEDNGFFDVQISPNEKELAIRFSNSNSPWELYFAKNVPNEKMVQITHSTTEKFKQYQWRKPEVIQIPASDGVGVYARIYEPTAEKKNGAAVLFVHGAGYLQNAHNYWSNYYREYMFHNLLTDLGYTVLDVDYRASEGYGRDYRTAIYRHMGGRDLLDFVDAKSYLVKKKGIDSNRVGIYGGSYGGFITLMGLLTTPNEFACGAALRSVTDWAHYNHEYTSNILNYPETDEIAYRQSSPIYFAQNLKNPLVMLHGMVDDNVQFQDVVRLSQRFIELGKKDWDLAVYPIESHGFKEAYSWYDEYRRIFELFEKNLLRIKN
ncbi:MAG: S9 family peptidase [Flavobacteriales bacterium]|nr:S9 family peptidase [Flavobacteriales bacterium]